METSNTRSQSNSLSILDRLARLRESQDQSVHSKQSQDHSYKHHVFLLIQLVIQHGNHNQSAAAWRFYRAWLSPLQGDSPWGAYSSYPGRNGRSFCICGSGVQYSTGLCYHCIGCKGEESKQLISTTTLQTISRLSGLGIHWIEYLTCEALWLRKEHKLCQQMTSNHCSMESQNLPNQQQSTMELFRRSCKISAILR